MVSSSHDDVASPLDDIDVADELARPSARLSPSDAAVKADERRERGTASLPLVDASPARPDELKPTWRGWIHAGTFPVTIASGIVLVCLAHGAPAKWASAVFMLTSMLLFGNSALYHRFNWKPRTKVVLKRIDHANIFLLIAGTYTPLGVLALPPQKGAILLSIVWGGALLGIAFHVFWITAPRWLYVPLYVLLGWAAMMYVVDLVNANADMMVLVFVGGGLYTIGALVYGFKRPNPFPGRFGFHEIFHTLTVLAFLCHWTASLLIVLHPAYNIG
jgi:hemolysin III